MRTSDSTPAEELSPIYGDGRHYDLMFAPSQERLQFWVDLAHEYGGPVLELTCGTGLKTIPIAQAGFQVTGIDLSQTMLAEARRKASLLEVQVAWVWGDVRNFDLDRTFPLILLPGNAICHLLTLPDLEACLACAKKHLRAGGRFVVEVFVPNLGLLQKQPDERQSFDRYTDPESGNEIVITQSSYYDPAAQVRYNQLYYRVGDREEMAAGDLNMRMYFPQELDALFKYNGFAIEHKYGGTDRSPFNAASSMQVFVLTHG